MSSRCIVKSKTACPQDSLGSNGKSKNMTFETETLYGQLADREMESLPEVSLSARPRGGSGERAKDLSLRLDGGASIQELRWKRQSLGSTEFIQHIVANWKSDHQTNGTTLYYSSQRRSKPCHQQAPTGTGTS